MVRALLDTNILIDYLGGAPAAKAGIARYECPAISVITWVEVLAGRAVAIRAHLRIRLPDAIIWASAQVNSMLLVSRNTKGFSPDEPGVRMPY